MRILLDMNHPADVHLFKNAIWELEARGHIIKIVARTKDITLELLDAYGFKYRIGSTQRKGLLGLGLELLERECNTYNIAKEFKPDLFLSHGSVSAAHVARLFRKPHITLDDTENSREQYFLYAPFTNVVLTPSCFSRDLGRKQIRYNGYNELAYLHPNRFRPDASSLREFGLTENSTFFIVRFVGWGATHDIGERGLLLSNKILMVKELARRGRVFISSEGELPEPLKGYKSPIRFDKMHDVMAFATLLIGESATMASECAVLGVPSLFISKTGRGYTDEEEEKYGLVFNFSDEEQDKAFEKMVELLNTPDLKQVWQRKRERMLAEKIDVTEWMLEFIENYPDSLMVKR